MFRNLYNECTIKFILNAESPISIRSGENLDLDPAMPDNRFIRSMHNGREQVVMPGSGIKGVFRSRAEKLLPGCCNVFGNDCFRKGNKKEYQDDIKLKYKANCPACRLFGSLSLKSRIEFRDAYPEKGSEVVMGTRHNVGIDRVTGSALKGALFEPEVLEQGSFGVEIIIRNYFRWQLKVVCQVISDINEGYVTFGGVTSRGFGRMSAHNISFTAREYNGKGQNGFYQEKCFNSLEDISSELKDVYITKEELERTELSHESIL
ncbi:CRISPR-associated Csx7 family protein [Anaerobacterium chartisolvens]|uniref:CRISPR-associated Csx7 family protein n=1 Tax=Anaerobacterium chartisolvens TaxID=1297424 RepID=A0A369AW17_9FIRM|nr:CRISPR-associated RAMP protein Csx7 [Anaerobacterium chartisolvens]RCX13509.1 CRISPR-associated Csx7 family protein [Anaerobacterium chartisolvens]